MIAVVTNIDPEHLDHYGSYEALEEAFVTFANRVPFWGLTVLCLDHAGVQAIVPRMSRRIATYGFASQADLTASDVEADGLGVRFDVRRRGERLGPARIRLLGRHNVLNALATLGVALEHKLRSLFASPTSAAVFLTINGVLLLAVERFRRRPPRPGDGEGDGDERIARITSSMLAWASSSPSTVCLRCRALASRNCVRRRITLARWRINSSKSSLKESTRGLPSTRANRMTEKVS